MTAKEPVLSFHIGSLLQKATCDLTVTEARKLRDWIDAKLLELSPSPQALAATTIERACAAEK